MEKINLLKDYIAQQAFDEGLWFEAKHITEAYLQVELRRVAWLIEEASVDQIKEEILLKLANK